MAALDIVIYPDSRLRVQCAAVGEVSDEISALLSNMAETMYSANGIGLAGPQVASTHRVIVVDIGSDEESGRESRLYKIVNPMITHSEGSIETEEGCLSIPEVREVVKRSNFVIVEGLDENGDKLTVEADDILAVCLQHEIDHLDGVLFVDHLSRLKRNLLKTRLRKLSQ